ncbi:ATP-binding cassette domain-containing protein [Desulfosporosinus sp. SYSU MS00001]|uniref:ATP-binding cassette domain-containing protein n=1 Tax=Desulfosporosinus sp. SYSU MS00001 TaxID=3416284 RepID=UPI003CE72399
MTVIQGENLTKSYGKISALDNLTFQIEENKLTGLIGRNGAGKTTLLKLIAGYLKPSRGEINVFSQNPFDSLQVAANIIFIDNQMVFPAAFRLDDILTEVAHFYQNWNAKLAHGLFDYFSFNPKQRHSSLSKGNQSTFNMIIGLAARCPLTIFDEPTSGMDSAVRKDFYRALLKDYLEYPRTIILSSHLLSEVEDILEDILLLRDGTKCLHQSVLELKEYALGLKGPKQKVLEGLKGQEILHTEEFAQGSLYAVIRNQGLTSQQFHKQADLELLPVSLEDLCIYLTGNVKGGIDYVFKQ